MTDPKKKPDLKTFIEDPEFQGDRDLLDGYFEHFLSKKEEAAKKKRDEDDAANPPNLFDRLFGGK